MQTAYCQTCGAPLDMSSGVGVCLSCALGGIDEQGDAEGGQTAVGGTGLQRPREFGPYELIEELGRGGMGVVYRARQTTLGRTVALKLLLAGVYSSESALCRFRREASAAAGLLHPNIVAIHDYGEVDGEPFYAMDIVEGRNLSQICNGKPLEPRRAATMLRQLAEAVQHAHENRVLHRDLKPSNVIVDAEDRPRITDFGLAKFTESTEGETLSGQAMGSPGFLAPEQARGLGGAIGTRTDVYGLGALFFHLLTGRAPFNAPTPAETFRLVLENDPPSPCVLNPSVPRDLETICLKCLETDPSRRYASAAELAEDADRFLTNQPIRARAPDKVYLAIKYARRHWVGVSATASVILALAVGLVATLVSFQRTVTHQRVAEGARAGSMDLVDGMLRDVQLQLQAAGRQSAAIANAEAVVSYYEALPRELYDLEAKRKHASALERLMEAHYFRIAEDPDGNARFFLKIANLWREIAEEDPDDIEAGVGVLRNEVSSVAHKRAGLHLAGRVDDWDGFGRAYAEEYRELLGRSPDSLEARLGYWDLLLWWAVACGANGRPEEAFEHLDEITRQQELVAAQHPLDSRISLQMIWTESGRFWVRGQSGEWDLALQHLERAQVLVDALLERDPANLRFLREALQIATFFVHEAGPATRLDAIRQARAYLATMLIIDPGNREWIRWDASMARREASALLEDRRTQEARSLFQEAVDRLDPIYQSSDVLLVTWSQSISMLGSLAAQLGESRLADDCLERHRDALPQFIAAPDSGLGPRRAEREWIWLVHERDIYVGLQDWVGLERLARRMMHVVDERVADDTGSIDRRSRHHAVASAVLGKALMRQRRMEDALPWLETATVVYMKAEESGVRRLWYPYSEQWEASVDFAEALSHGGEYVRATEVLEWAFDKYEAHIADGGKLLSRISGARCAWKLTKAMANSESGEVDQQRMLLDRAAELLDDPETAPRLLPEEREMRAEIESARSESAHMTGV